MFYGVHVYSNAPASASFLLAKSDFLAYLASKSQAKDKILGNPLNSLYMLVDKQDMKKNAWELFCFISVGTSSKHAQICVVLFALKTKLHYHLHWRLSCI